MRGEREKQIFRETQGARISRWVRDSEAGWLFYGPGGTAYHILSDEAARLEAEGKALIERVLGPGFVPVPGPGTALLLVIGVPFALAFALAFAGPAGLAGIVIPVVLILTVGPLIMLNIANDAIYELSLRRWRRRVAARLAADSRGGVPEPVAEKHRRYNLFLFICLAATFAAVVTIVLIMMGELDDSFYLLHLGFLLTAIAASPAARKVDDTHRRRKWFD